MDQNVTYRAPTLTEAVEFLMDKHHTRSYRKDCIAYWRERFGDVLADQAQARVRELWGK